MVCRSLVPWWYKQDRCLTCSRARMLVSTQLISAAFTVGVMAYAFGLIRGFCILAIATISLMLYEAIVWRFREVHYEKSLVEDLDRFYNEDPKPPAVETVQRYFRNKGGVN